MGDATDEKERKAAIERVDRVRTVLRSKGFDVGKIQRLYGDPHEFQAYPNAKPGCIRCPYPVVHLIHGHEPATTTD